MWVTAPARRSMVEQTAEGFQYRIRSKKQLGAIVFLPLWLVAWSYYEAVKVRDIMDGIELSASTWVWLVAWTLGGLAAIHAWLSVLIGEEIITVTSTFLAIQRNVTGLEPTRRYELARMRNLRVDRAPQRGDMSEPGAIAFDYGMRTIRFGGALEEAEAKMIVAELTAPNAQLVMAG